MRQGFDNAKYIELQAAHIKERISQFGGKHADGEPAHQAQIGHAVGNDLGIVDLDAIIPEMLTDQEREQLNDYHKKVYEIVAPHLNNDEREWLKEYTRAI